MKIKNIILLLILFLIVGCESHKTELDRFKIYLKKEYNFKCSQNICKETRKAGKLIEFTNEINFDSETITYLSNGNNGLNTSKTIYNWKNNTSEYNSSLLGIVINASYNYNTDEFICYSDYEDKEYVDTECNLTKLKLKEKKDNFDKMIKESGTLYFNK